MAGRLAFDGLDWALRVHESTIRLYEEDEIAGWREGDVADGDVPMVGHQSGWSPGGAGKSVEVGDEDLGFVSTEEFLHFFSCDFELWSDHGVRCASRSALKG